MVALKVLMNIFSKSLLLFATFICKPAWSQVAKQTADQDPHTGEAFIFYIENDSRIIGGPGSDQAYSNGFKFSYIYAEDKIPEWARGTVKKIRFLEQEQEKAKVNFGVSFGQQIYTPNNTDLSSFISDDRPYAGWMYLGLAASFKEEKVGHFFELDIGAIGPSALGKEVQNNYHELIHEPRAEGWEHSLHDEPTLQLFYQRRTKSYATKNFDSFHYYGAGFGNVMIGAHVGIMVRGGINLLDDFGPSRPSATDGDSFVSPIINPKSNKKSYYGFAGIRGNALARNIFLDGNTFRDSHHVTKYPFTFETEFGAGLQILPLGVVWRFVTRSPEFKERSDFNSFASINVIYFL